MSIVQQSQIIEKTKPAIFLWRIAESDSTPVVFDTFKAATIQTQ